MDDLIFPAFSRHMLALADLGESAIGSPEAGFRILLDELMLEMPVELDIRADEAGAVVLGATPPVYYADTAIRPVFHQLKITFQAENPPDHGPGK